MISGFIETTANVGLEIADVVDLTDPRANLSATKRTVVGIKTTYDIRKPRFDQRLALAGAT